MKDEIYKVTGKKITKMLDEERERKEEFMNSIIKKVRKCGVKGIATVAYREDPWDNSIRTYGIVFTDKGLEKNDMSQWKEIDSLIYKGKYRKVYTPYRKTKEQKELYKKVTSAMVNEKFFQKEEILEALNYKPKDKLEDVKRLGGGRSTLIITTFRPGWKKDEKGATYFFRGFKGYTPPRGVKEILPSEYNRIFSK